MYLSCLRGSFMRWHRILTREITRLLCIQNHAFLQTIHTKMVWSTYISIRRKMSFCYCCYRFICLLVFGPKRRFIEMELWTKNHFICFRSHSNWFYANWPSAFFGCERDIETVLRRWCNQIKLTWNGDGDEEQATEPSRSFWFEYFTHSIWQYWT